MAKDKPLYECMCKATDKESGEPRYSQNWVAARRATFKVFDNRVQCGDWIIPFSDVTEATVYNSKSMMMKVRMLQITTAEKTFQFGFNPWAKPIDHIDLQYQEYDVTLQHSVFSICLRLGLTALLLYQAWIYFT